MEQPLAMQRAGIIRRFVALCADWALAYFVAVFLAGGHGGRVNVLQYLVFYFEVILFTSISGASAGQNLMKLKIIHEETGAKVSFVRVVIRTTLLMFVLPALFTSKGRGFHDIAAKSEIVSLTSASASQRCD